MFPEDFLVDYESKMNLLSTIRVPKNLLYLTDRLPKATYDKEQQEMIKRRTFEPNNMLPEIPSKLAQKKSHKRTIIRGPTENKAG